MKRLITMLLLCTLLTACAPARQAAEGFTFTDDLGRTVTVDSPQRVACLLGSFADIWVLAGGEVIAAPDDAWVDYGLPMAADAVDLGSTKELSLESLFAADPDLVLASVNTEQNLAWREILEGAQIPVAYFEVSDFDGYLRLLKTCTYPLTAKGAVHRVITELAVIDVTENGFLLVEVAPGVTPEEVQAATEATLIIPEHVPEMKF